MAPPRPTTDGSYGKNVRNWGENVERSPEDCVLTPPRRAVSNAGGFESRIQSTLIKAPPPDNTEKKTKVKSVKKSDTSSRLLFWKKTTPDSKSKRRGNTESTIQGRTTIRLSVLPVGGNTKVRISAATGGIITPEQDFHSFTPHSLLDIENGTSILVTKQQFLDHHRFQELGRDGAIVVTAKATGPVAKEDCIFFNERGGQSLQERIRSGDITDLHINAERGILGGAWRGIMRKLLLLTLDETNGLRLGRQLQLFLPFLTGLEAYILSQVIEALDGKKTHLLRKANVEYALKIAFLNRNVSRIIVQNIGPRWDYLFHWDQAVTNLRLYDVFSQIPILGNITSFPATENFPDTRDHAVASTFRILFGKGNWITRVLTQNRQGLNTDDPDKNIAQNLAAESNGFELANRNQYGTYIGRLKTNQFRVDNRLPADESIVRTFVAQPMPTLVNNGVVHTLRQLAKHWHNVIVQLSGNFSHQRMEQLDPFETMRLHMPVVCIVLASLRGRNKWDSMVLGPFIRKCQELKASFTADGCRYLVREMQENIVVNLCGGIAAVVDPLRSWLDAIHQACDLIQEEAKIVYEKVTGVEVGLRLGHDLMTQVTWKIPKHTVLQKAILDHIRGEKPQTVINERRVRAALALTTPRDKRTLMELVKNNLTSTKPAKMLLGRVKTLLQREIRREAFNEAIRELSMGEYITEFVHDEWYWFEEREKNAVYIYDAKVTGKDVHRFIHVDSGTERFVSLSDGHVKCRAYVPVAEAICRAQRCYMEIELDHGKKFKYNAFMEFSYLRISLRRLAVISQVFCEELDNARLHVLREIQRSNQVQVAVSDMAVGKVYYYYHSKRNSYEPFVCDKEYTPADPEWTKLARKKIVKVPPQSVIVVGGGPAGLMAVIHCTESVLVTGGEMKLYEARDAFSTGGSTFERAQIVRLDARWIAMLRYHLGTGFEDIYIPASGETDAQLGNTL